MLNLLLITEPCDNKHSIEEDCLRWAAEGECESNPWWMSQNCASACQLCHRPCLDTHNVHQCKVWLDKGECQLNPAWMYVYCAKTCNACDGGERVNSCI